VEIEELWVSLLLFHKELAKLLKGIRDIVFASPFTMNDNMLVIGDKLIRAFNTVFGITPTGLLEEQEFLVCHVWFGGCCIYYGTSCFKSNIILVEGGCGGVASMRPGLERINIVTAMFHFHLLIEIPTN